MRNDAGIIGAAVIATEAAQRAAAEPPRDRTGAGARRRGRRERRDLGAERREEAEYPGGVAPAWYPLAIVSGSFGERTSSSARRRPKTMSFQRK